jgi:ribose/xylose/arabinose/galactoside ABC-type transport system permease subunit
MTVCRPSPVPFAALLARFLGGYGQEIVIACAIVVLFAVVGRRSTRASWDNNINTIFAGNAYIAVAAIGMSMIIITGHIDVSVGALIGVIATDCRQHRGLGLSRLGRLERADLFSIVVNAGTGALVAYGAFPRSSSRWACCRSCGRLVISVTGGAWINNLPPEFMLAQQRPFEHSGPPSGSWSC